MWSRNLGLKRWIGESVIDDKVVRHWSKVEVDGGKVLAPDAHFHRVASGSPKLQVVRHGVCLTADSDQASNGTHFLKTSPRPSYRTGAVAVRSWESDEGAMRVHIVPAFADLPLSSLTSVRGERFLLDLATSRSVRTAARVRTTLRGLFTYAVRTRRLWISPAEGVPLPRPTARPGEATEVSPFTLPELLSVVEDQRSCDARYAEISLVLGLTGLRMGELREDARKRRRARPVPGAGRAKVAAPICSNGQGHRTEHHQERTLSDGPLSDLARGAVDNGRPGWHRMRSFPGP